MINQIITKKANIRYLLTSDYTNYFRRGGGGGTEESKLRHVHLFSAQQCLVFLSGSCSAARKVLFVLLKDILFDQRRGTHAWHQDIICPF
jgi:hypothetical protein